MSNKPWERRVTLNDERSPSDVLHEDQDTPADQVDCIAGVVSGRGSALSRVARRAVGSDDSDGGIVVDSKDEPEAAECREDHRGEGVAENLGATESVLVQRGQQPSE